PPATPPTRGVRLSAATVHIIGLSIGGFTRGIDVTAGLDHSIVGSYLGVAPDPLVTNGTSLTPNTVGIAISGGTNVLVGGTGTGEGNVIAGNTTTGVDIQTAGPINLFGNLIGTDRRGISAIPNGKGVSVELAFAIVGDGTTDG